MSSSVCQCCLSSSLSSLSSNADCCADYELPDCLNVDLNVSCCGEEIFTVVLTRSGLDPACPGGTGRPTTAADDFNAKPGYVWTGAMPADLCVLGDATVLFFCRVDPITGEHSWWFYIADNDLSHTWYSYTPSPQYHQVYLSSCSPFLVDIGANIDCGGDTCIWTWSTGGCFVAGTMVSTLTGLTPIERIKVGDRVLDANGNAALVLKRMTYEADQHLVITDELGVKTGVTAEHPFVLRDGVGLVEANDTEIGQELMYGKIITDVEVISRKTKVYNLTVSGLHTYVANGFAVHNKKV